MKTKNIVLCPVFELDGHKESYAVFRQMGELCKASFKKNLRDLDDFVVMHNNSPSPGYQQMFRDIFLTCWDYWKSGYNVFFTDADALCIAPFSIFHQKQFFRLFAAADGSRFKDHFSPYMLSGSRYMPSDMPGHLWYRGDSLWCEKEMPPALGIQKKSWDFEQFVYNCMFFAQFPQFMKQERHYVQNHMNCFFERPEASFATILSFNAAASWRGESSLSMEDRLRVMEQTWEKHK